MALDFDNPDDDCYVVVADHADFDPGGAMTFAGWLYVDAMANSVALGLHDMSEYKWLMYLAQSGAECQPAAYIRQTSTSDAASSTDIVGGWHHLAMTFDRTLGSLRLKLYLDGSYEAGHNAFDADIDAGDEGVHIATQFDSLLNGIDGKVDELAYWTTALTAGEIATLASSKRRISHIIQPASLKMLLRFDDFAAGATASGANACIDLSGNGHHGTPTNNPTGAASALSYPSGIRPVVGPAAAVGLSIPVAMRHYRGLRAA